MQTDKTRHTGMRCNRLDRSPSEVEVDGLANGVDGATAEVMGERIKQVTAALERWP